MRDTDLYGQILGLQAPWCVDHVDLDVAKKRVDVWLEHETGQRWKCARCDRELACRDHAEERVWLSVVSLFDGVGFTLRDGRHWCMCPS